MNYIDDIAHRIKTEVSTELLPEENTELLFRIYAVLALSLGEETGAENVHDAWSAWMSQSNPSHNSIHPFSLLTKEVQDQDRPFLEAIKKVSSELRDDTHR